MILPEPPEPKLWKAWLVMCFFVAPVAWSVWAFFGSPLVPTIVIALIVSFVAGSFVFGRMKNDWRATDTMAARHFDYYTGTHLQKGFKERE
jgi:hypothetical protein